MAARTVAIVRNASLNPQVAFMAGGSALVEQPELAMRIGAEAVGLDAPTAPFLASHLLMRQTAMMRNLGGSRHAFGVYGSLQALPRGSRPDRNDLNSAFQSIRRSIARRGSTARAARGPRRFAPPETPTASSDAGTSETSAPSVISSAASCAFSITEEISR